MDRGDRVRAARITDGLMLGEEAVVVGFYRSEKERVAVRLANGSVLVVPTDALEVAETAARPVAEPARGQEPI